MTYAEALAYLNDLSKFGIHLGLQRIATLLDIMGHPENKVKVIHVGGTNGKGSTVAFLTSILSAAGYKVGTYTSPHLCCYTERIAIQGQPIDKQSFANIVDAMRPIVEQAKQQGCEQPTEFEVLTAGMFQHFVDCRVDLAVIEVGLGGRYDSTNVVHPFISVITNVQLDHMDRCGSTIEEIAWHKAGIVKAGTPVVTGATGNALAVIEAVCKEQNAPLTVAHRCTRMDAGEMTLEHQVFAWESGPERMDALHIGLLGRHQLRNASLALLTIRELNCCGYDISEVSIRQGLAATRWPGRVEVWHCNPTIILDGAHNPDGAAVLAATLQELFADTKIVFILGILKDKDIAGIISCLEPLAEAIVVTEVSSPRTAKATELSTYIRLASSVVCPTVSEAIRTATELADGAKPLCICGSLYLLQDVYAELNGGYDCKI